MALGRYISIGRAVTPSMEKINHEAHEEHEVVRGWDSDTYAISRLAS